MISNLTFEHAASALTDDVIMDDAVDSPTSIPCGITISITLNC
jgi:hypothetical protein